MLQIEYSVKVDNMNEQENKYKWVQLQDGRAQVEHRAIMEEFLGRKLSYNEIVHHKMD